MLQAKAHKAYLQTCDLHGCLSDLRAGSDTKKENFSHYKAHVINNILFPFFYTVLEQEIKSNLSLQLLSYEKSFLMLVHMFFSIFPQKECLDSHLTKTNLINSQCSITILTTFSPIISIRSSLKVRLSFSQT